MADPIRILEHASSLIVVMSDGGRRLARQSTAGMWLLDGPIDPGPDPEPSGWIHPLQEQLPWTTYPDNGGSHDGGAVDIPTYTGHPLYACTTGTILYAGLEAGGGGNVVVIQPTGTGVGIVYAHMNSIDVATGQAVNVQDVVGTVGMTGTASGPHLHLEVRQNGIQWGPWFRAVDYFADQGVAI